MAMQRRTWSINALSAELGLDRRTLSKRLQGLPPVETKKAGNRVEKRWHLADVVGHMSRGGVAGAPTEAPPNGLRILSEAAVRHFVWWLSHEWVPVWTGLLKVEGGLDSVRAVELYAKQYGLMFHYLDEYLSSDVFNRDHQEQTGHSLDDLASMAERKTVISVPPEPGGDYQVPDFIMEIAEKGAAAYLKTVSGQQ